MVSFHLRQFKMLSANRTSTLLSLVGLYLLVIRKRTNGKVAFVMRQQVRINYLLVGHVVVLDKQGVAGRRLSPAKGVAEDPAGWVSKLYSRRE